MHEDRSATSELEEKEHPSAGRERYDPRPLGLALAIYLIAQAGVLFFAVSPGADSSRFIAFAERLRSEAFFDVLRSEEDHPGYPLFLYGIFSVARWMGIDSASHLLLLAELASVAAGTLILILIHRTLASLSGPRAAAAATFSLALLPRPLWIFADVLSDPLHALFWVAGACAALVGLRDCRVRPFVVAGLFGALAYAIRPEALTLLATILCALVMVALHPESRRAWGMGRLVSAGGAVAGL
ncbi:MAG TPA: hypothetical protein VK116_08780, partial [Planctomycetota bacterium]|nr:hypothetical protein [Planctomycetota bacterium]